MATRINGSGVLRGLVLDRQPLWRTTFASMLHRSGFATVGVCTSADEFERLFAATQPHLVIVDSDGAAALTEAAAGRVVTIVATSGGEDVGLGDVVHLSKCDDLEDIANALERVIVERIDWAKLTSRELEILRLVAQGASNRQVGATLWLSDQTIKFHLAQVYRKLRVPGRREAVERLREAGLLAEHAPDGAEPAPVLATVLSEVG